jgi:hypothetical protein
MFTEIKNQFIDGLEEQNWMDEATRAQARLKVSDKKACNHLFPYISIHPIPKRCLRSRLD